MNEAVTPLTGRDSGAPSPVPQTGGACLQIRDLWFRYGELTALKGVSLDIPERQITAFIGPSGCGKTTLLRCCNRMNDLIADTRLSGSIHFHGQDIHAGDVDVAELRRRVGMVFQRANPFPKSVYDNVAFGLRLHARLGKTELDDRVEAALKAVALWEEVVERLDESALTLSGGQQQRLVLARAIAVEPEVLLLDEPAAALDPISTLKIEELMQSLKADYTIAIVTHNMQQAARASDFTAFLHMGELVEFDSTDDIFTRPARRLTEDYITGRYG